MWRDVDLMLMFQPSPMRYSLFIVHSVHTHPYVKMPKILFISLLQETLESFAPSTRPRIPSLIVQCVHEIERRGLEEVFLLNNTPTQG